MNFRSNLYILALCLVLLASGLSACSLLVSQSTDVSEIPIMPPMPPQPAQSPTPAELTVDQIMNAPYVLAGRNTLETIQLVDGVYQKGNNTASADIVSVRMSDQIVFGDLNGDGADDAAAIVTENYNATGIFVYLAVYLNNYGFPLFHSTTFVDDRPMINNMAIQNGEIYLDVIVHSFQDALCCPTFHATETFKLSGFGLELVHYTSFTPDGLERVIQIDSPFDGMLVSGSVTVSGIITIAPFENNLSFLIYNPKGDELAAGPIMVTAAELGEPGTFNSLVDLSVISPGLVIRLEIKDISMADGSLFAMDSVTLNVK